MVCPRGGGIFSLSLGFTKKTVPIYMGYYRIFFYSKANAPYFPGVRVSIDRCINVRFKWKMNRTPFFLFVKAARRLLSFRFGIRSCCFFQKKISNVTFFRSNGLEKTLPKVVVVALNQRESLHEVQ